MPPLQTVYFCNSGAEANEAAIKAARRAAFNIFGPDKSEIIAFNDAFHGRTIATITAGVNQNIGPVSAPCPQVLNTYHLIIVKPSRHKFLKKHAQSWWSQCREKEVFVRFVLHSSRRLGPHVTSWRSSHR